MPRRKTGHLCFDFDIKRICLYEHEPGVCVYNAHLNIDCLSGIYSGTEEETGMKDFCRKPIALQSYERLYCNYRDNRI